MPLVVSILSICTVFGAATMQDNLIDDSGFELGLPSREEMLKHQVDILCSDLELTRRNVRAVHRERAGLIVMSRGH